MDRQTLYLNTCHNTLDRMAALSYAFNPDQARDDHGKWVAAGEVDAAKADPAAAEALRSRVTNPKQRAKLEAALGDNARPMDPASAVPAPTPPLGSPGNDPVVPRLSNMDVDALQTIGAGARPNPRANLGRLFQQGLLSQVIDERGVAGMPQLTELGRLALEQPRVDRAATRPKRSELGDLAAQTRRNETASRRRAMLAPQDWSGILGALSGAPAQAKPPGPVAPPPSVPVAPGFAPNPDWTNVLAALGGTAPVPRDTNRRAHRSENDPEGSIRPAGQTLTDMRTHDPEGPLSTGGAPPVRVGGRDDARLDRLPPLPREEVRRMREEAQRWLAANPELAAIPWGAPMPPHLIRNAAQPSDSIRPAKAREILHDGTVHGHPLTPAQRGMFGAAAGRSDNARDSDARFRYGAEPAPNRYNCPGFPHDSFGRPRGVMATIGHGAFRGGRFGAGPGDTPYGADGERYRGPGFDSGDVFQFLTLLGHAARDSDARRK